MAVGAVGPSSDLAIQAHVRVPFFVTESLYQRVHRGHSIGPWLRAVLASKAVAVPSRLRPPAEDACLVLLSAENFIVAYFPWVCSAVCWRDSLCLCLAVCSLYIYSLLK